MNSWQLVYLVLCTIFQVCLVVASAWFFLRRQHFPISGREYQLTLIFNLLAFL
jgi:hypothetical protein